MVYHYYKLGGEYLEGLSQNVDVVSVSNTHILFQESGLNSNMF